MFCNSVFRRHYVFRKFYLIFFFSKYYVWYHVFPWATFSFKSFTCFDKYKRYFAYAFVSKYMTCFYKKTLFGNASVTKCIVILCLVGIMFCIYATWFLVSKYYVWHHVFAWGPFSITCLTCFHKKKILCLCFCS